MTYYYEWQSEAASGLYSRPRKKSTIRTNSTDETESKEPKLPVQLISGTKLADCKIILRRDPADARSKVSPKEYNFWDFKRAAYNNDRDSFRTSDLVNDYISKAIEKFKRDSSPRKQDNTDDYTYTDVVQFTTPRFGDRICEKDSPCDYVAAVEEMIDAGLKRFPFRITTSKVAKKTAGQSNKRKPESEEQSTQSKKQKLGVNDSFVVNQSQVEGDVGLDTPVAGCRFANSVDKWGDQELTENQKRQTVNQ